MTDNSIDAEIEANEQRGKQANKDQDSGSIVDYVEGAFGNIIKPMSNDNPDEADLEERREENDAEQR